MHRLLRGAGGVIAGPLAERAFDAHVVGLDEAFDDDLGIGRDRQAGDRPLDHLDRRAAHAADDLVFAHAVGHLAAAHEEAHRIAAEHDRDRHRLLARLVLVAHLPALLAGRDVEAAGFLVVDHHAVGAAIDPALVGIADDGVAAGADVAAAVLGVPLRRREFGDVDRVAGDDVLHHRAAVDVFRRDALHVGGVVGAEAVAQLDLGHVGREAERHVLAPAVEEIDQHAAARQRVRHVLEHEARRVVGVVGHLGHHADVLLPGEALGRASPRRASRPPRATCAGRDRRDAARCWSRCRPARPRRCRPLPSCVAMPSG